MADGSAHPFTGYNKPELRGTLVGNWVEENALKGVTGDHRYTGWVAPPQPQDVGSLYATKVAPPKDIDTFSRVFAHSDNLLATEWRTAHQSAFQKPTRRDDELRQLRGTGVGLRTAAALAAMAAEAADLPPGEGLTAKPPLKNDFLTVSSASYTGAPRLADDAPMGRRVLKTQDGLLLGMDKRDRTFLAETGLLPKADADRVGGAVLSLPREFDSYIIDTPCTIYTMKNQEGKLPGTGSFPASGVAGPNPNPFGKNSAFSRPVRDPFKTVTDE